ncbi:TraR/DksA C4-type zinc finger protein [Phytomonospora sp. NPDC050363]|uniref:TraR/DksA family transcriptional regulator n=1 Tax=Phytomonospora sp. NPDC050363 TaxID=3155642 RepID=UPI0033E2BA96
MPAAKATGGTPAKKTVATKKAAAKKTTAPSAAVEAAQRSPEEVEQIRAALTERLEELRAEYSQTVTDIAELQRDRLADSAGDDQVDTGSKTLEREQEITLANTMHERVIQVEHALERLEAGNYGMCERCGKPIPAARLAAFPSATLCVDCKQLEERR